MVGNVLMLRGGLGKGDIMTHRPSSRAAAAAFAAILVGTLSGCAWMAPHWEEEWIG